VYGLAFAYMELGDIELAQKHFQMVLDMQAPEELRALARNGLREIAVRELKARGPRMDAVFYLLDAMRLFSGKTLDEVREVAFEIGLQGQYSLDINDPKETHVLRSLPGRTFSALELLCIMQGGFKKLDQQSTGQSYANFFRLALGYDAQSPEVNKSAYLPRYGTLRDRKTLCDITDIRRLIIHYIQQNLPLLFFNLCTYIRKNELVQASINVAIICCS